MIISGIDKNRAAPSVGPIHSLYGDALPASATWFSPAMARSNLITLRQYHQFTYLERLMVRLPEPCVRLFRAFVRTHALT